MAEDAPAIARDTDTVADVEESMSLDPEFDYRTQYADIADIPVNEIIGQRVYGSSGQDVGEIDNVGILDSKPVVVVGIGGFLGLGEHSVALGLDRMEYDNDRQALVVSGYTEDELKEMPEYDEDNIGFLESEAPLSEVWSDGPM